MSPVASFNELTTTLDTDWTNIEAPDLENSICDSVGQCVGRTPLIRLSRWAQVECPHLEVLGKFEAMNPGGSIKDRIAVSMLQDAPPKCKIIESSSGNTAVGLAMLCAPQGRPICVTVPDNQSMAKEVLLRRLGAEVVRTNSKVPWFDDASHVGRASAMTDGVYLNQYLHAANPAIHYATTGAEILRQCGARPPDYLIATVGTAGTIRGVGGRLKAANAKCRVVGVEPEGSVVRKSKEREWAQVEQARQATQKGMIAISEKSKQLSQCLYNLKKPWKVEGIGKDFIPPHLAAEMVDEWVSVVDKEAFLTARDVIRMEGLLIGGSAGAALAGLKAAAARIPANSRVVVILPDGARTYMNTFMDDGWMYLHGMLEAPVPVSPASSPWGAWTAGDLVSTGRAAQSLRAMNVEPSADPHSLIGFDVHLFRVNQTTLLSRIDLKEKLILLTLKQKGTRKADSEQLRVTDLIDPAGTIRVAAETPLSTLEYLSRQAAELCSLRNPGIIIDPQICVDRNFLLEFMLAASSLETQN